MDLPQIQEVYNGEAALQSRIESFFVIDDPRLDRSRGHRSVGSPKRGRERGYYISRLAADADDLNRVIRGRWSSENSLQWVLAIAFRDDDSRLRRDYGREKMATLRHIALNRLKQDRSIKVGIKSKRKKAGGDADQLLPVLNG